MMETKTKYVQVYNIKIYRLHCNGCNCDMTCRESQIGKHGTICENCKVYHNNYDIYYKGTKTYTIFDLPKRKDKTENYYLNEKYILSSIYEKIVKEGHWSEKVENPNGVYVKSLPNKLGSGDPYLHNISTCIIFIMLALLVFFLSLLFKY